MADSGTSRVKLSLATPLKVPLSIWAGIVPLHRIDVIPKQSEYLQPIITQYFIDNKSEIWLLFLIAHSKR